MSYQQQQQQQQRTPATGGRRPIGSTPARPQQQQQECYDDDFDMRDDDYQGQEEQGPPPEAEFPDTDAAAAPKQQQQQQQDEAAASKQASKGSRFSRQRKAIEAALPGARPQQQGAASSTGGPAPIDPVAGVKVEGLEATAGGAEEEDDPYSISAAAAPAPGAALGGVKWEEVVQTDAESGEAYVPFFWVDAHEQNGVIYLFGKVKVGEGRFVSAACSVQGVQHSLLVLPRRTGNAGPDGKPVRFGMGDVYKEVHDLLVPGVIPKGAGHGFKCKPVKRRYAFEVEDVPRGETEYLKVVYAASYGLPSPERCEAGGRFFERVFGSRCVSVSGGVSPSLRLSVSMPCGRMCRRMLECVCLPSSPRLSSFDQLRPTPPTITHPNPHHRTTALERFVLKRQLMGPSWIKIRNPQAAPHSATIAKFEFTVADPKHVEGRWTDAPAASPPMVVMSLALKTVVNAASQLHEVGQEKGTGGMGVVFCVCACFSIHISIHPHVSPLIPPPTHTHTKHQVVAISTMVHTAVQVDGPTETTPQHVRQGKKIKKKKKKPPSPPHPGVLFVCLSVCQSIHLPTDRPNPPNHHDHPRSHRRPPPGLHGGPRLPPGLPPRHGPRMRGGQPQDAHPDAGQRAGAAQLVSAGRAGRFGRALSCGGRGVDRSID